MVNTKNYGNGTIEAELISTAHATKEAVWIRRFLTKMGETIETPFVLNIDNHPDL